MDLNDKAKEAIIVTTLIDSSIYKDIEIVRTPSGNTKCIPLDKMISFILELEKEGKIKFLKE
jgi:hypothetical protein